MRFIPAILNAMANTANTQVYRCLILQGYPVVGKHNPHRTKYPNYVLSTTHTIMISDKRGEKTSEMVDNDETH